jgi:hypothetical protein
LRGERNIRSPSLPTRATVTGTKLTLVITFNRNGADSNPTIQ